VVDSYLRLRDLDNGLHPALVDSEVDVTSVFLPDIQSRI
jgi:hypothetical protein